MKKFVLIAIGLSLVTLSPTLFSSSLKETRLERGSTEPYLCPGCGKWAYHPHSCKGKK